MADAELLDFIASKQAKNTWLQTERAVRKFTKYLTGGPRFETRQIEELKPTELDTYIAGWLKDAKKDDGTDYEPDSLTSLHRGLGRYLEEKLYDESVINSPAFSISRKVLATRRKELKKAGKGNRPNRAEPLTAEDEELLWETGLLGLTNPHSLLNLVWYNNTKLLGFRGNDEARHLKVGDFKTYTEHDMKYIVWNERSAKTPLGAGPHYRQFQPKLWENGKNDERCPVRAFETFINHRPTEALSPDYPFYLAVNHTRHAHSTVWYMPAPLGKNQLQSMMSRMCEKAGVIGHKTNHSVRGTIGTALINCGVRPSAVVHLKGHQSVASLKTYSIPDIHAQRQMCNILTSSSDSKTSIASIESKTEYPVLPTLSLDMSTDVDVEPVEKRARHVETAVSCRPQMQLIPSSTVSKAPMSPAHSPLAHMDGNISLVRKMSAAAETYNYETLKVLRPSEYVVQVEVNRPEKRNAQNRAFYNEMADCFKRLASDTDCRAVVISAAGKMFTSGIDLMDLAGVLNLEGDVARKAVRIRPIVKELQESFNAIEQCPKPVIVAVHNACIGGGIDLITACDIRYCSQDAWFAVKEVDVGLAADLGTLQRLPKVVGNHSLLRELAFTGRRFEADEAKDLGLVSRVFPDRELMVTGALDMAAMIASKSPVAVQGTKVNLLYARDHSVADGMDYVVTWNQNMLQSEDLMTAATAGMQKTTPTFSKL